MNTLKQDTYTFTQRIIVAISNCYDSNNTTDNNDLMQLYTFIRECICKQGENGFIVHLSQVIAEQFPSTKGFSTRNLRRMRDFYQTYHNDTYGMKLAMQLGWTHNVVIFELCQSTAARIFYMSLAIENCLSKLTLIKSIEDDLLSRQNHNAHANTESAAIPMTNRERFSAQRLSFSDVNTAIKCIPLNVLFCPDYSILHFLISSSPRSP